MSLVSDLVVLEQDIMALIPQAQALIPQVTKIVADLEAVGVDVKAFFTSVSTGNHEEAKALCAAAPTAINWGDLIQKLIAAGPQVIAMIQAIIALMPKK